MLGGTKRKPRRRDAGSTSTIGLAISAAVFAGAFMVAQMIVAHPADPDASREALDAESSIALDSLIASAGQSSAGGSWTSDPDHMTRFGLALDGQPNFLDYAKIKALRNASLTASSNGLPDYPEVLAAMGLKGGDVHIRTYPVMPNWDDSRFVKEQHGRLAYMAHYSGAVAPVNVSVSIATTSTKINVSVTLRNDGLSDAIYSAAITLADAQGGAGITQDRNTALLENGDSQTVWATFDRLPSWDTTAFKGITVDVTDPYGNAATDGSGARVGPTWTTIAPIAGGSNAYNLKISAADLYDVTGTSVKFALDDYNGNGDRVNNAQARFVLIGPNGNEWRNSTLSLERNKETLVACSNCTATGTYTGVVWDTGMTRRSMDRIYVSPSTMFTEKATISAVGSKEIQLLQRLVSNFNPTRYDAATNPEGDVFGDDTNGASDIVGVMSRYSTIVVGSEIAQTALTPSAVKNGFADWVQQGGNLVVLGTYTQQSRWLEPIYHAAQTTANGGISAPDATHPILVAPEHLSYQQYLDRGRAWSVELDEPFTHVLTRGVNGLSSQDTLVVANPGAYNNGTVVLTSYMPGSLTSPQDDAEATRLLHNLLSQAYTMLFLDFGPPIPNGVPVGSEARLVAVPHPNVPGAIVEVRIVLYRWG